mgnify:CR=1 FL=1
MGQLVKHDERSTLTPSASAAAVAAVCHMRTQNLRYTVWPSPEGHAFPKLRLKYKPNLIRWGVCVKRTCRTRGRGKGKGAGREGPGKGRTEGGRGEG